MLTSDSWNGLIDVVFILVICARLAIYPLLYLVLAMAIAFVYIGMRFWRMIPQ